MKRICPCQRAGADLQAYHAGGMPVFYAHGRAPFCAEGNFFWFLRKPPFIISFFYVKIKRIAF